MSSDQPYPPCEKNEGKQLLYIFCLEKGSDVSLGKDSLLLWKLIPIEQCDLLRWTHPAAASLKSVGTCRGIRETIALEQKASLQPSQMTKLILCCQIYDLEFKSNDFEINLGTEIPYVSSKKSSLLVVPFVKPSFTWGQTSPLSDLFSFVTLLGTYYHLK